MAALNMVNGDYSLNEEIECFETVIDRLKASSISAISDTVRSKLNVVLEKLSHLVHYWDVYDKRAYYEYKIHESLWRDQYLLRYVFEDCITYVNYSGYKNKVLYCIACKTRFDCTHEILVAHLSHPAHMSLYMGLKSDLTEKLWGNFNLFRCAFEKYIEIQHGDKLYCKLCGVIIPMSHINLLGHLYGNEHRKRFEEIAQSKFSYSKEVDNSRPVQGSLSNSTPVENKMSVKENDNVYRCTNSMPSEPVQKPGLPFKSLHDKLEHGGQQKKQNNTQHILPFTQQQSLKPPAFKNAQVASTKQMPENLGIADIQSTGDAKLLETKFNKSIKEKIHVAYKETVQATNVKTENVDKFMMKHNEFMRRVVVNLEKIKYFCQPCCVYVESSSVKSINQHHHDSKKHKGKMGLNFKWNYCKSCNAHLYCDEVFINMHNSCEQHLLLQRSDNISKNTRVESTKQMPENLGIADIQSTGDAKLLETEFNKNIEEKIYVACKEFVKAMNSNVKTENVDTFMMKHNTFMKKVVVNLENIKFFCQPCCVYSIHSSVKSIDEHYDSKKHKATMGLNFKWNYCESCNANLYCDEVFINMHNSCEQHLLLQRSDNCHTPMNTKSSNVESLNPIKSCHTPLKGADSVNAVSSDVKAPDQVKSCHTPFTSADSVRTIKSTVSSKLEAPDRVKSPIGVTSMGKKVPMFENGLPINSKQNLKSDRTVLAEIKKQSNSAVSSNVDSKSFADICKLPADVSEALNTSFDNFIKRLECNALQESKLSETASKQIEADIKTAYPKCRNVITVGSRALSLAQDGSRIDLFIETDENYFDIEDDNGDSKILTRAEEIVNGLVSIRPTQFNDVEIKSNVITAVHNLSKLKCKIFFQNGLCVENAQLVKAYLAADFKVRPLILLAKECARHTRLSQYLSGNSINWMVLNYLILSGILNPPAALNDRFKQELIPGWNVMTLRDTAIAKLSSTLLKNHSSDALITLAGAFFKFYADEDYDKVFIPRTAERLSKTEFVQKKKENLDTTKSFCLQDPFVLHRNLTENINSKVLCELKSISEDLVYKLAYFPDWN